MISPVAFNRAIGDFSVAVLFMVRPNLPMAIFKKIKVGGHHEKEGDLAEVRQKEEPKPPANPMYARYMSAQRDKPDAVVLIRLGDFYEVMGERAREVSEWLNLTLTSRDVGLSERVPMCGFPYHVTEQYLQAILEHRGVYVLEPDAEPIYILSRAELSESERSETAPVSEEEQPFDETELSELQEILSSELADGQAAERPVLTEIEDDEPNPFDEQEPEEEPDETDWEEAFAEPVSEEVKPAPKKDEKGIQDRKRKQKPQMSMFDMLDGGAEKNREDKFVDYCLKKEYSDYKLDYYDAYRKNLPVSEFVALFKRHYGEYSGQSDSEKWITNTTKGRTIERRDKEHPMRVGDRLVLQEIPAFPKDAYSRIEGMIVIRDELRRVLDMQTKGCTDEELKLAQSGLSARYDSFVRKYGFLNGQTNARLFREDGDAALFYGYYSDGLNIRYNTFDGSWKVERADHVRNNAGYRATETYGTNRANAFRLFEDCLNQRATQIFDTVEENGKEKRVLNKGETIAAREKQNKIKEAFADWIYADPNRREDLEKTYNRLFNQIRLPSYDGSFLKFPGMNPTIELRPHQKNAVARIAGTGNSTLLHHVVGSGKSYTMAASAMKLRQYGLAKKPMIVVPNHLVQQMASEFRTLYPTAKILIPANAKIAEYKTQTLFKMPEKGEYAGYCFYLFNDQLKPVDAGIEANLSENFEVLLRDNRNDRHDLRLRRTKLINDDEEEKCIERMRELRKVINATDYLTAMNEKLFDAIVEKVLIEQDGTMTFRLKCELEFSVERW